MLYILGIFIFGDIYILGIIYFGDILWWGNSHQRCSRKKAVLTNLAKFAGKHLCQSLFLNKVAGQRPEACNFIKKREFDTGVFLSILQIL